jgi:hypothetical protein
LPNDDRSWIETCRNAEYCNIIQTCKGEYYAFFVVVVECCELRLQRRNTNSTREFFKQVFITEFTAWLFQVMNNKAASKEIQ